ncbi:MAG: glycoside hydrolase family 2 protein, partial [Lachnospiraceae bacterium]|nr:glycoside hydrolase family 2 protein [Lachnospiraceae bacterium]
MRTSTILKQAEFAKNGEIFSEVKLPHTWNAFDGQDGGNDYWRGLSHYKIKLPNPQTGLKQFIRFEGANHIARVSCNGTFLGEHKGGFSTFVYELTDVLKPEENELTVDVTNEVCDVYPQMADFTFYGGIYRNVTFIEVSKAHFDFSKCGTDGLFVTPYSTGKTRFDIFTVDAESYQVAVAIKDAEGNIVKETKVDAKDHTIVALDVREPHLWNGMKDPYCYTAEVCLEKNGFVVDKVSTLFGYRSFRVDAETGFYLNGVSCP